MSTEKSICPLCRSFASNTFGGVLRHIGEVHSFTPGFRVECGLGPDRNCPATYTNYHSFRSHIYKKHREELYACPPQSSGSASNSREPPANFGFGADEDEENAGTQPLNLDEIPPDYDEQLTRAAALFILKTMEIHKTSQVKSD